MTVVWKYPVELVEEFSLEMPSQAELLCVQTQHGLPFLWAEVNPETEKKTRRFRVFGTGHPIDTDEWVEYVGTFQLDEGHLVFHLYEVRVFEDMPL